MKNNNQLIAYALDFVSFLISRAEKINRIILFGSIARGDFDDESDIDLFIDTKNKKLESTIQKITTSFNKTQKAKRWNLKGIHNPFSCLVGELDSKEWKDLKRGMITNGLILYGKYKEESEKIHQYTLFSFKNIKPESKRVSIHRSLFGFKAGKKNYPGLVDTYNAIKMGKGAIAVPIEHTSHFKNFFHKKKVAVKVYDIWSDYDLG